MSTSPFAPHHHHHTLTGRTSFFNPWKSAYLPSFGALFQGAWLSAPLTGLEGEVENVEVVRPDWGKREIKRRRRMERKSAGSVGRRNEGVERGADQLICGTWLGHAGAFVEMPLSAPSLSPSSSSTRSTRPPSPPTLELLFDPIFSARASPVSFFGPKRMHDAPCRVKDLPGVDAVFISHNQGASADNQDESWRRTRREQGLWLEGRLDQLDTEIAQLEHELSCRGWDSSAHPAPHNFAALHGSSAGAANEERSLAHGRQMGWRAARRYFGEEYAGQGRGF